MEDVNISEDKTVLEDSKSAELTTKNPKNKRILTIVGVVIIVLLVGGYFAKGFFIAAMVNGKPISRFSVISELEKQGGKRTLESLIEQQLIETALSKKAVKVSKQQVDEEIKKIETQITGQGSTLKEALETQGMTEEKLREQIAVQKKLEVVLADKTKVSDEEIEKYITESKIPVPAEVKPEDFKKQVKEQLERQKFQTEAQAWVADLTKNANITYFVKY